LTEQIPLNAIFARRKIAETAVIMRHLLTDTGIAIITATMAGLLAHRFRQPIILAYFLAGVIIGPEIGPHLVMDRENIEVISEMGLILLLFIIGLEMHPAKIISIAGKLILPGIGQFFLTLPFAFLFFLSLSAFFPFHNLELLYLAAGISLSSTAIVIKTLHDKYELDTFAGRITVGILIFQDIWAIFVIVLQPQLDNPSVIPALLSLLKGGALVAGGFYSSKYILKFIFESITHSPEMIVAVAIGWCALFAGVASFIGLSMEMGALIAGISISTFPYSMHITLKIQPLRDFFLTLFFISLGMKITPPGRELLYLLPAVIFATVASRFLILYPLLRLSGSSSRNSFIASLNLSQISEFSTVIATIGMSLGHVDSEFMSLIIYSMAITAILSSYFIRYNHQIYRFFSRSQQTSRDDSNSSETESERTDEQIYILGYHRGAKAFIEHLGDEYPEMLQRILVIDFNEEVIHELNRKNIRSIYGDFSSSDTLSHAGIQKARYILSTIPDQLLRGTDNRRLVEQCRQLNPNAIIIATADHRQNASQLESAGANHIILPYAQLAKELLQLLKNGVPEE